MMLASKTLTCLAFTAAALFCIQAQAAIVLIDEDFGGSDPDVLNSTSADTFAPAITSAGGSATWTAATVFQADGDIGGNGAAFLDLGSYVNDTKGNADGIFTLTATLGPIATGSWVSFGFLPDGTTTAQNFVDVDSAATFIYRNGGELDGFAGLKTGGSVDGDVESGTRVLTTVLDLTGHDGVTNFGTATYYDGDAIAANLIGSADIDADADFGKVGLTTTGNVLDGKVTNFTLSQTVIPEPASLALLGVGSLLIAGRNRRPA